MWLPEQEMGAKHKPFQGPNSTRVARQQARQVGKQRRDDPRIGQRGVKAERGGRERPPGSENSFVFGKYNKKVDSLVFFPSRLFISCQVEDQLRQTDGDAKVTEGGERRENCLFACK